MKNQRSKAASRRRGTIIILVVAVLALLAVIGTIFIISARTERAAANAASANVDMILAQKSAMNAVVEIIGNAMYDSAGNVGGYDSTTAKYGKLAARNYDYPDSPPINLVDPNTGATISNSSVTSMRGEPWLAPTLHNNPTSLYPNGYFPLVTTGSSTTVTPYPGDSYLTYMGFDPTTGTYDYPMVPPTTGISSHIVLATNVVNDQTTNTTDPTNASTNSDGIPASGASVSTATYCDAYWNLLPFSDASGIRYRYAVRILDTSRMANLNTGATDDTAAIGDTTGTFLDSMRLAPSSVGGWLSPAPIDYYNAADTAANLHCPAGGSSGRAGTSGTNSTFNLANWQRQVVLQIENPQDAKVALFDLSDELELRSYGEYGTPYHARPTLSGAAAYTLWPNTLSNNPSSPTSATVLGNPARRNYTAYSFSRDIRPFADPTTANPISTTTVGPFTLTPTDGIYPTNFPGFTPVGGNTATTGAMNIWPPSPVRINPNPDVSSMNDSDAVFTIAAAATNMATAMNLAGFNGEESVFYAASYTAQRCNVYTPDPNTGAYVLNMDSSGNSHGPSFVDDQGICVRTLSASGTPLDRNFGGANDLTCHVSGLSTSKSSVYLGYAAQPFINEVAVEVYQFTKGATQKIEGVAWAVELYNPYSQALSLKGFKLRYGAGASNTEIDLGTLSTTNNYIPAGGYYVIYSPTDQTPTPPPPMIQSQINTGANVVTVQGLPAWNGSSQNSVILERVYYDRASDSPEVCPLQIFDFSNQSDVVTNPPSFATSNPAYCTWQQNCTEATPWSAAIESSSITRQDGQQTLGKQNSVAGGTIGVHLYDRNFENTATTAAAARKNFTSITDFNHILREGSSVNNITDNPRNHYTMGFMFAADVTTTPKKFSGLAANDAFAAQLYFYFSVDPKIYSTLPPSDPTPYGDVDVSAIKLLDCITFIDRVSDPTIDLLNLPNNGSKLDINKIRLPGKININTASGDVLRALPGIQLMANPNQVVANILAYRVRAGSQNTLVPSVTYNGTANNNKQDYSVQTNYPGVGFRSLAEVTIPIYDALGGRPPVDTTTFTVFDKSDASWSSIFNLCTIRSDTFVVYGYLEALQGNPNNAADDNLQEWYTPSVLDGTINTAVGAFTTIRVARLRWVAIVDRSFCNYPVGSPNFQMPRIVAIKDLPR